MAELRPFNTYWSTKTKCLSLKSGRGTSIMRLHKREVSSLSADKINELLLYNKSKQKSINKILKI